MTIQWFPGHMTKAKRQLEVQMQQTDIVIELRDARAVMSSANPLLTELSGNKPRLVVLGKADLADPKVTEEWIAYFKEQGITAIYLDVINDDVNGIISKNIKFLMKDEHERQKRRGIRPRASRALVVGIPNVGKSTLINRLAKKKVATTANKPGLTRALKLVKVNQEIEVVDSPGMLWPRFEDESVGINLALIGAINEEILPYEQLVKISVDRIDDLDEILNLQFETYEELIYEYGKSRNSILDNDVDTDRSMTDYLRNLRNGKILNISWEHPNDFI